MLNMETYLTLLRLPAIRTALSKFRTCSHNLEVERGRHKNPVTPLERRLCLMCQEIEYEMHFTTHSLMYKSERPDLYTKVRNKFSNFCTLDDSEKFIILMQSNDAHVITWMATFVYRSLIQRSDILLSEVQEKRLEARLDERKICACVCVRGFAHTLAHVCSSRLTMLFYLTLF